MDKEVVARGKTIVNHVYLICRYFKGYPKILSLVLCMVIFCLVNAYFHSKLVTYLAVSSFCLLSQRHSKIAVDTFGLVEKHM